MMPRGNATLVAIKAGGQGAIEDKSEEGVGEVVGEKPDKKILPGWKDEEVCRASVFDPRTKEAATPVLELQDGHMRADQRIRKGEGPRVKVGKPSVEDRRALVAAWDVVEGAGAPS